MRETELEYEQAVIRGARLGLGHRELAGAAQVSHGTIRAIIARTDTPPEHSAQSPEPGQTSEGRSEQPGVAGGVMGRTKRTSSDQSLSRLKHPGDAVNLGGLQCFFQRQRRQNGGQTLGQHRFASPRRANQQNVMSAGSGNLQRALDRFLAFDF